MLIKFMKDVNGLNFTSFLNIEFNVNTRVFSSNASYECERDMFCIQQVFSNSNNQKHDIYTNIDSYMLVKPV